MLSFTPTLYPCSVPVILNWGSLPNRLLSMGLVTQSYFVYHVPPSVNLLASLPALKPSLLPVGVVGWDEEVSHQRSGWSKGPVLQSLLPHWPWPLCLSLNHWGLRGWFQGCLHFIAKNIYLHLCDSHSTVSLIQLWEIFVTQSTNWEPVKKFRMSKMNLERFPWNRTNWYSFCHRK